VEHVAQKDFHVEVPLNPVNDVDAVEISFLVEPAVGDGRLQYEGDSKLPDTNVIRDEMKHGTEVLFSPEVSELLEYA